MPRLRPSLREAVFALSVVVLVLGAAEIALRVAFPRLVGLTFYALPPESLMYHEEHPALFWYKPDEMEAALARIARYRGKDLVVTLGGSVAAGWHGNSFADAVEALLAPRVPDFANVKLAFGGYTSYHSRILLDEVLRRGTPRVVVVCNGINDQTTVPVAYREVGERNRRWTRRVLLYTLNRAKTFVVLRHGIEAGLSRLPARGEANRPPAVPLPDYVANLESMARRCRERGVALVLIGEATPDCRNLGSLVEYQAAMRDVALRFPGVYYADTRARFEEERRRLGLPCLEDLDLDDRGRESFRNALFTDACCHLTWAGARVMADPVARILTENRLVGD
jgi:lysophospholipase L1-like esterase